MSAEPLMAVTDTLLSVRDLTIATPRDGEYVNIVENVSFDVAKGEVFALVGESGSGKSLTVQAILGLLPLPLKVTSGEVWLQGREITNYDFKALRKIRGKEMAMIFQDPMTALNPVIRVGDQVCEAIRLHNKALGKAEIRARALDLLRQVGIPNAERRFTQYPNEFSGGMRQRVVIAIAMANEPSLLIADEPTTALDVTIQAQVMEVLEEVRARTGAAMILITHDLGLVAEHADKIGVLYAGRMVEKGNCREVFERSLHPYTAGLIASLPRIDRKAASLYSIPGYVPAVGKRPPGCAFIGRCQMSAGRAACHNPCSLEPVEAGRLSACHFAQETPAWVARTQAEIAEIPLPECADRSEQKVLEVKGLMKEFLVGSALAFRRERLMALREISFDLLKGRTLGVVGESGCGKSTLAKVLLRLLDASGGSIMLNGQEIINLKDKDLRQVRKNFQVVFQDPYSSLNPGMSVHDIIAEPMYIHGGYSAERVNELLGYVGMTPDVASRTPAEFSGGQRQRIAIARTLALNPDVIILDEAVSALDVSIQAQVINLLRDLQERLGLSYIFISHNLSVVRHISDDVAVMYLGRIVEYGPTDEIFDRPGHPYTEALLSAIPVHHAPKEATKRIILEGDLPNPLTPPSGCVFRTRCFTATPECAQVEQVLKPRGPNHVAACMLR